MKRTSIIFLTFDFLEPIFSGNGTLSRIQVTGLLEKGFSVLVICPELGEIPNSLTKWIQNKFLKIIPIKIDSEKDLSHNCDWAGFYSETMKHMPEIISYGPNLIVNPDWHTADVAIKLKNTLSIPLIGQFFRIFSYFKEYFQQSNDFEVVFNKELKLVQNSNIILTLSSFDREWCIKNGGKTVKILYPPLSEEFINTLKSIKKLEQKSLPYKLFTISRLVPEKKLLRIFPILKKLKEMGMKFHYTLIGEALDVKYEKKIRNSIHQLTLSEEVDIIGRVSLHNLIMHLCSNPIYIHTSSYEPFGITIIEAAAAGCTIILDQEGLIGARELLMQIPLSSNVVEIQFSKPSDAANILSNLILNSNDKHKRIDDDLLDSKFSTKQYIEKLVNVFRHFH
jgi:glycosyltransferase involved in cell wall biosynthesis